MKTLIRKKFYLPMALLLSGLVCLSFVYAQEKPKPWSVPDASKNVKNPTKADKESLETAKALYDKHCKSCHGAKGLGDGTKAKTLETSCGDFSKSTFQAQTDGEIFYKTKEGRDDMPAYKKKIQDDNDLWLLVNYLRTLKGGK